MLNVICHLFCGFWEEEIFSSRKSPPSCLRDLHPITQSNGGKKILLRPSMVVGWGQWSESNVPSRSLSGLSPLSLILPFDTHNAFSSSSLFFPGSNVHRLPLLSLALPPNVCVRACVHRSGHHVCHIAIEIERRLIFEAGLENQRRNDARLQQLNVALHKLFVFSVIYSTTYFILFQGKVVCVVCHQPGKHWTWTNAISTRRIQFHPHLYTTRSE